ncbi:hypothetical protein SUDANB37_01264 [Streptomyces sp. enrichment culture]
MNARRRGGIRPGGTPSPPRRPGTPARTTAGEARTHQAEPYGARACVAERYGARMYRARAYAAETCGARCGAGAENGSGKR